MNFENYKLNDFLMDESFHHYARKPNSDDGKFWEVWLKDHPENQIDAKEAKKIINAISFEDLSFDVDEITSAWEKIKEDTIKRPGTIQIKKSFQFFSWKSLKVAAVILPFVIASVLFTFYRTETQIEISNASELIVKKIPKGQKLTVFLSDGSKVILNSESKISYLKPFESHQRMIELEGEAFFEVAPDKDKPFIVKSEKLITKVLGTSFNIRAYPSDKCVNVAVRTGKVSIETSNGKNVNEGNFILLHPLEMVTYNKVKNSTRVSGFDPQKEFDWSKGILHFDDVTMKEFVSTLERWYDVEISVKRDHPIANGIVGTFSNQTLKEILMGTSETSEFEYEFLDNGKILIK